MLPIVIKSWEWSYKMILIVKTYSTSDPMMVITDRAEEGGGGARTCPWFQEGAKQKQPPTEIFFIDSSCRHSCLGCTIIRNHYRG